MRIFTVDKDGSFDEFKNKCFKSKYEEKLLEEWLEKNPDGIIEESRVLIIGRQVNTNLGGFIDLLGLDKFGNVVVIELKRDRTPRDTIAQALEYSSFIEKISVEQLENILKKYLNDESLKLAEYHKEYFQLSNDEAFSFNKEQHIVIVGQKISPEIKQTSNYLLNKGIKVTCVEFSFFQTNDEKSLISQEIIVGKNSIKQPKLSTESMPKIDKKDFIKSVNIFGRKVFNEIFEFAKTYHLPIHWGTKGFSLNYNLNGIHIPLCYFYPPESVYKQTVRTLLYDNVGINTKTDITENEIKKLYEEALNTKLFEPAGRELKMNINKEFQKEEIKCFLNWIETLIKIIDNSGLKN
ncbi:MAG: hypothetical protein ACQESP_12060 [Candidatus Muiribacteriota bacterium]